ncbi:MAG: RDD family protein [Luteolibacter sp.]
MEEPNSPATPVEPTVVETPAEATGNPASIGQRIAATLIDIIVAIALSYVAGKISGGLAYLVSSAYLLTRDSLPFLDGQSIGKKALNLQAVSVSGKTLSGDWKSGILRNVLLAVPFGGLVELIVLIANKDKPGGPYRLGDDWAKTKVVTTAP